jgi:hypothetical protein
METWFAEARNKTTQRGGGKNIVDPMKMIGSSGAGFWLGPRPSLRDAGKRSLDGTVSEQG